MKDGAKRPNVHQRVILEGENSHNGAKEHAEEKSRGKHPNNC